MGEQVIGQPRSPDETFSLLQSNLDQAQQTASDAFMLRDQLESIAISQWSFDREVRIVLASNGKIKDIEFSARALAMHPATLARVTLGTIGKAAQRLLGEATRIASESDAGEIAGSGITDYYLDTLRQSVALAPDEDE